MTGNPSIFRRGYDAVALFAILNLMGLGGLVFYLSSSGTIDGAKLRRIVQVVRGEELSETEAASEDESAESEEEQASLPSGANALAESQMNLEIMRREGELIRTELDQRLALNNAILLRVTTEREGFARERQRMDRQQEASLKRRRDQGFKKQIDIYESLAPKIAVQHLLALQEPDDAARILLDLDTRKAKKIIEAAKRADQLDKMKTILRRVREVAPEKSSALESNDR